MLKILDLYDYSVDLRVSRISKNKIILRLYVGLKIAEVFFLSSLNFLKIFRNIYLISGDVYRVFCNWILSVIGGFIFSWIVRFLIVGYHYTIKVSKLRGLLKLRLGFRYKILIIFPNTISIFYKKRYFSLVGKNIYKLIEICKYIRNLRNLFPYKRKGLVFLLEKLKLKPGKKAKLR